MPSQDLLLLRKIFLEAVGGSSSVGDSAATMDSKGVDSAAGAPRLSPEQVQFLTFSEEAGTNLEKLAAKVSTMAPETLMSCSSLCAEILSHCNLAESHDSLKTWKACLRADTSGSHQHEGKSLPTFQAAFEKMVNAGVAPADIREALMTQKVDVVLTAHPTQAQRRTILLKWKRIVELLEEHELLTAKGTPGELHRHAELIQRELRSAWRTSSVRRSKPSAEGEARNGMAVVEGTLWKALPEHYRRIDMLLLRNGLPALPHDAAPVQVSSCRYRGRVCGRERLRTPLPLSSLSSPTPKRLAQRTCPLRPDLVVDGR